MKKGRQIKNLPVINILTGRVLGSVREIKVGENQKIEGLYILTPENRSSFVAYQDISSIGRDAVLVNGMGKEDVDSEGIQREKTGYDGSWVMSSAGKSLGYVDDIVIEENDGSIVGYEISDGYIKDILIGRKVIYSADILTYGKEAVIVEDL